jgi:hypothetical protein
MYLLEMVMRKTFLFLMILAGSCLGVSGCALGGLLPGVLSNVGFSALSTLLSALIGQVVPAA